VLNKHATPLNALDGLVTWQARAQKSLGRFRGFPVSNGADPKSVGTFGVQLGFIRYDPQSKTTPHKRPFRPARLCRSVAPDRQSRAPQTCHSYAVFARSLRARLSLPPYPCVSLSFVVLWSGRPRAQVFCP
jgi:hypothetical protein